METVKLFDKACLNSLLERAAANERLRQHEDLRDAPDDTSQRMLNALCPGTVVPMHRHEETSETVVCLLGRIVEVLCEPVGADDGGSEGTFREVSRTVLCPSEGTYGMQVPRGAWHTVEVLEPSVILEMKNGPYVPR